MDDDKPPMGIRGMVFGMLLAIPMWAVILGAAWLVVQASRGR